MKLKTLAAAVLFAAFFGGAAHATAPNVVFLSTLEDRTIPRPGYAVQYFWKRYVEIPLSIFKEEAENRGGTFENWDESLDASAAPLDEAMLKAADIIVIVTNAGAVDTARFDIIKQMMETTDPTKPQTFIIFSEAGAGSILEANFHLFADTLAGMAGGVGTYNSTLPGMPTFPLNSDSPYAAAADGVLPDMKGSSFSYMANIPSEFALYTLPGFTPGDPTANSYLTFVPHDKANGGACTFLVGDLSLFNNNGAAATTAARKDWTRILAKVMLDTRAQFCKPSEYAIKVDPVAEGTVTCPATVTAGGSVTCSVSLLAEGYEFDTLAVAGNATLGPCDANGCTLTGVMGALTVQGVFKAPPQPPQPQPQPVLLQPVLPQSPACAAAPSACSSAPTFGGAGLALAALALPAFAAPAFRRRKKTGKKADTQQ